MGSPLDTAPRRPAQLGNAAPSSAETLGGPGRSSTIVDIQPYTVCARRTRSAAPRAAMTPSEGSCAWGHVGPQPVSAGSRPPRPEEHMGTPADRVAVERVDPTADEAPGDRHGLRQVEDPALAGPREQA
jgi:hypothetical protein